MFLALSGWFSFRNSGMPCFIDWAMFHGIKQAVLMLLGARVWRHRVRPQSSPREPSLRASSFFERIFISSQLLSDGWRPYGVVLSQPLHGGSREGGVTRARINKRGVKEVRSRELSAQRCRHKVFPRTPPAPPPGISAPLAEWLCLESESDVCPDPRREGARRCNEKGKFYS